MQIEGNKICANQYQVNIAVRGVPSSLPAPVLVPVICYPDLSEFLDNPATAFEDVLHRSDLINLMKKHHEQLVC